MDIRELVRRFEATQLSKAAWTHQAHLLVALWYVATEPDV